MLDLFKSLTTLVRCKRIHIDGCVFRLHCIVTVIILMGFVIVNSAKQIVGEPISCNRDKEIEDKEVANAWCYIKGIHSIPKDDFIPNVYPGMGPPVNPDSFRANVFYQWIWFMLLFQAICFYFPRWLWKCFEGNKIFSFTTDFDYFSIDESKKLKKIEIIVDYLYQTNGNNDWYAIKYFLCELLALLNVILQMAANNIFLSGQFYSYGIDFIEYHFYPKTDSMVDPLDTVYHYNWFEFSSNSLILQVFPIQSKCNFSRFGISGSIEYLDFMCVLTINIFNQKIYLFCWFWFIILIIFLTVVITFRVILICCPLMRYYCCRFRFDLSSKLRNQSRKLVVNRLSLGDWFILYLVTNLSFNAKLIDFSKFDLPTVGPKHRTHTLLQNHRKSERKT